MIPVEIRVKREARSFARSLLSEGYRYLFEYNDKHIPFGYITLRHHSNGSKIAIMFNDNSWSAKKNNKVIKYVKYE